MHIKYRIYKSYKIQVELDSMKVNNFFDLWMNKSAVFTSNLDALDSELFTKIHSL